MTENFVFWAQALDNSSPDHIEMRGEELGADDSTGRQEAVSLVSGVVKSGARVFNDSGVQLTINNRHFVIEVPSAQRDQVGRMAPIICCGDYGRTVEDALGTSVAKGLSQFAKRIGRSLQSEHFELIHKSFEVLKKKSSTRRLVRKVVIRVAVIALLVLVYWVALRM